MELFILISAFFIHIFFSFFFPSSFFFSKYIIIWELGPQKYTIAGERKATVFFCFITDLKAHKVKLDDKKGEHQCNITAFQFETCMTKLYGKHNQD